MNFCKHNRVGPIFYVIRRVSFCRSLPCCGNFSFRGASLPIDSIMESSLSFCC